MSSRRIRQHVNPLRASLLAIDVKIPRIPFGAPVEVELGSAEAHFLIDRARQDPEGFYVGIEIRDRVVAKANEACRKKGLTNVVSVFANMQTDLTKLFDAGRVNRFFLNFPDPWFKSWQHKRRVADERLIEILFPLLRRGGEIHVNTDIFDIALDALAAMESYDGLTNQSGPWRFARRNPLAARSRRERQCEQDGSKIWRVVFRKDPDGSSVNG